MRLKGITSAAVFALGVALLAASCDEAKDGGGGATGGTTAAGGSGSGGTSGNGGTGAGGTSSTGGTPGTGGSSTPGVVTYADVKQIFVDKCGNCHATGKLFASSHTLATSDADAKKPVTFTSACAPATTKGACTIVRIKSGAMPSGGGCKGDPAMDSGNEKCLTADQQAKLQAWIDGGLQ